jgi:hypothetical protein
MDAKENARLQEKAANAQEIAKLKDSGSFQYLKLVVEKKRDLVAGTLVRALLAGTEINQRRLDYERGYWDGAMHIVNRPENAEAELVKALKRLEAGE